MKLKVIASLLFVSVLLVQSVASVSGGGEYRVYFPVVSNGVANVRIDIVYPSTSPEGVKIANHGGFFQDMTGWKVVSVAGGKEFYFPNSFALRPGGTSPGLWVLSGNGAYDDYPNKLMWTSLEVWKDSGDVVQLWDNHNRLVASHCYGDAC